MKFCKCYILCYVTNINNKQAIIYYDLWKVSVNFIQTLFVEI